ncbi:MAG: hypothetical protein IJV40_06165 [Oscillospiraceae bacterium]|nr:hypothetical protein [Oscillospiraceae bacterium]
MKRMISLLCAVLLLVSLSCTAVAAPAINNSIKGQDSQSSGLPGDYRNGLQAILDTGDGSKITLPESGSYFSTFYTMYIDAPKNNSVYVYRDLTANKNQTMPVAYQGIRVLALAEEKGLTCIVYHDHDNVRHAGWVNSENLASSFPGDELTCGSPIISILQHLSDPEVEWSRDNFVGAKQKYTLMEDAIQSCQQFTLDYQVTARNGAQTNQILGPRTVYVNDGSGWEEVATFDYYELGAVHVTVNLSRPMDIAAVATVATCAKPDVFSFRQCVLDPMV